MTSTELSSSVCVSTRAKRVGIQGYAGAFHEVAARRFFKHEQLEVVPAHSFPDLVTAIEEGVTMDAGLMAIENTLAGSLMANYRLLLDSDLLVTGEVFLHIQQNLLTLPGVKIEELREVHSHPVAIAQCRDFFKAYPHIQLVETADTALSARDIRDNNWTDIGAIASGVAADLYALNILAESIETNKKNYTRFLVLEKSIKVKAHNKSNKISLSFTLDHEVGGLHKVLAILAAYNVNLTKIQSAPIIGKPWEYLFFIDFIIEGNVQWEQAINAVRPITHDLNVLGAYVAGVKNENV